MTRELLAMFALLAMTPAAVANDTYTRESRDDRIGQLLTYERSNQDGTRPEIINVYRVSETRLEVMKSISVCTQAALVSAELDFETWSADTVTGAALLPNAEVMEFAFLRHNRATNRLITEVRLPDQTLSFETGTHGGTVHLYDFDLASLTALTPYLTRPEQGFSTSFAQMWPDPSNPSVTFMGEASFEFSGQAEVNGMDVLTFTGSGALGEGYLWLDANDGHIVQAAFEVPNHPGYSDFLLRLVSTQYVDSDGWHDRLVSQFDACAD